MNLIIKQKNTLKGTSKKITLDVEKCNLFGMFRGLMFRRREKVEALLFDFETPRRAAIHSLFVFFPFVAIWLDEDNKILEIKKVFPWKFFVFPKMNFCKLIEIPINERYRKILKFLDEN